MDADLLTLDLVRDYTRMLHYVGSDVRDPVINPLLFDENLLTNVPPCHIMVCGRDPLRDHGLLYEQKLKRLG